MSDKIKHQKKYGDDFRDISIVKRQAWLQNQVPWSKVIRKDKKWRKSPNRTFRSKNTEKIEPDPYQFRHIPSNISEVLKTKRLNLGLSVQNLSGIYVGPADMASSYGMGPKFDIKEDPVYSNIKLIAKKCKEKNLIAGIHTGSTSYAKEMIKIGYNFVTIL